MTQRSPLGDDGSDSPPMCIPPPAPTTPPDTLRDLTPPDHYATADQVLRLTNMVSECLLAIATLKPAIVSEVKGELNAATAILSAEIEAVREEVTQQGNRIVAHLDRQTDNRITTVEGKMGALANIVSDHLAVARETADLAVDLARQVSRDSPPSLSIVEAEE